MSQNSSTDNGASTSTDPVPAPASTAARDTKKKSAANAWSALDGLWALLQRAAQLQQEQPMLLAHVMHALSALWECQGSAPSAVELLRSQTGFWDALKVSAAHCWLLAGTGCTHVAAGLEVRGLGTCTTACR